MSFAPVYDDHSRALILGTWPSPKSREMAFYYGHPQNRFWPLLAALTGEPLPVREDIAAKKQLLLRHGLALWDTLESCTITGASDASIRDVFAISISFVVPKLFTAIAFDAGGVASGPMTATFLLPLAQGACVAVGGNIVTDAFGVVAMVAMTPLITVQMMGLVAQLRTRKARTAQPAAVLATVFADLPDDAIIEL